MAEEKAKAKKQEAKAEAKAKPAAKAEAKPVEKAEAKPKAEPKPQAKKSSLPGLLGRKLGMTQLFDKEGRLIPVTVIEAGPCFVVQKKTVETDGYNAVQLGFGKGRNVNGPLSGHFEKAKVSAAPKYLREIRMEKAEECSPGEEIRADVFAEGDMISATGTSIGKGTAGTVKRWHFGRGPMTHGSKSHRLPGSIGAGTTPGRVLKGTKMSGRLGAKRVTVKNLKVVKVDPEKNVLLVAGPVPGPKNGLLVLEKRLSGEK